MKLYYSNGSPFARKVRIALIEKGLPFEADVDDRLRPIDEMPGPTLAVPVLEDDGQRLWESDLIVDYLLKTYPDSNARLADPPLAPWLARPDHYWHDMTVLATIATCANTMVNMRFMNGDGLDTGSSDYLARQRARFDRCLDWLEERVTPDGFIPGWFSILDIAFVCPMVFCEKRNVMPWRGRAKLEALYERAQQRPSFLATPINDLPPMVPRYRVERTAIAG